MTARHPSRLDRLGRHEVLAAGVVDEDVEAAVALEHRLHDVPRRVVLAPRLPAATADFPADLRRGRLRTSRAPPGDRDLGAAGASSGRRPPLPQSPRPSRARPGQASRSGAKMRDRTIRPEQSHAPHGLPAERRSAMTRLD